jgi:hypothetical protein
MFNFAPALSLHRRETPLTQDELFFCSLCDAPNMFAHHYLHI